MSALEDAVVGDLTDGDGDSVEVGDMGAVTFLLIPGMGSPKCTALDVGYDGSLRAISSACTVGLAWYGGGWCILFQCAP